MKFSSRLISLSFAVFVLVTIVQVIPIAAIVMQPLDKTKISTTLTKCLLDKDRLYTTPKVSFYDSDHPFQYRDVASISPDCPSIIKSYLEGDYNLYNQLEPSDSISAQWKSVIRNIPLSRPQLIKLDKAPGKHEYQPFLNDERLEYFLMSLNSLPAEFKTRQLEHKDPQMTMDLSESKIMLPQNLNTKAYLDGYLVDDPLDKQEERSRRSDKTSRRVYMGPLESGIPIKRTPVDTLLRTVSDVLLKEKERQAIINRQNIIRAMLKDGR